MWKSLSRVQLFATPWIVAHQAPLSMEFPKQEYWSHSCLQGTFPIQDQIQISHLAGEFFTIWATKEAQWSWKYEKNYLLHICEKITQKLVSTALLSYKI